MLISRRRTCIRDTQDALSSQPPSSRTRTTLISPNQAKPSENWRGGAIQWRNNDTVLRFFWSLPDRSFSSLVHFPLIRFLSLLDSLNVCDEMWALTRFLLHPVNAQSFSCVVTQYMLFFATGASLTASKSSFATPALTRLWNTGDTVGRSPFFVD